MFMTLTTLFESLKSLSFPHFQISYLIHSIQLSDMLVSYASIFGKSGASGRGNKGSSSWGGSRAREDLEGSQGVPP